MAYASDSLDYEIKQSDSYPAFHVWTPDESGAIIGMGATREEAVKDAIASLGRTIAELAECE